MKAQRLPFVNQQGVTLLESLIALILFSIIVLGSSAAIKQMLSTQKDMNISFIVINEMQQRLQKAQDKVNVGNVCDRVETTPFSINSELTYYFECTTKSLNIGGTEVKWPILAASSQSATIAKNCAADNLDNSCYVVGK
ncbi:PulJ/GspJ family protein [Acinetobacter schindleri]|mgnify:CR=1 FL=1|uniref:PulJ/GspJ family protein n=1 Tax=Acinetobacter schindleri TaxID=108981 RepID=UPI003F563FC3